MTQHARRRRVRIISGVGSAALGAIAVGVVLTQCGEGNPGPDGDPELGEVRIVAANNLGMHCMDREYSVYSILPPFNVVNAQVVANADGEPPRLLGPEEVEVVYEAVADASGSVNSTSVGKTDFWEHANALFGVELAPGEGLMGLFMPADAPSPHAQPMAWSDATQTFTAAGIPITSRDDDGAENPFPLLRVVARARNSGTVLAFLDVVVPVATETDCSTCHASGKQAALDEDIEWSSDSDLEVQTKLNVLLLHDAREGTSLIDQTPVLCASCHYSPALDLGGTGPQGDQVGKPGMSKVMHHFHGSRLDGEGQPVFPPDADMEATCYACHPGNVTRCYRGAMAESSIECDSCHGGMLAVGGDSPLLLGGSLDGENDGGERRPWMDLPRCQSCHTGDAVSHLGGAGIVSAPDGIRSLQAWLDGDASASPLLAENDRFAEEEHTLFQASRGHGGLMCQACHGSTHAEWPNADPEANDNVTANQLQGHAGVLIECSTCHGDDALGRTLAGPHGLHPVGDTSFVDEEGHGELFEHHAAECRACHGVDLEGTVLSRTGSDRSFRVEERTINLPRGTQVGCAHCHEKPGSDD